MIQTDTYQYHPPQLTVTNATSMDFFQDANQQWKDKLNAAVAIFKEQPNMILEARNNVVRYQQVITQQVNQIAYLQA